MADIYATSNNTGVEISKDVGVYSDPSEWFQSSASSGSSLTTVVLRAIKKLPFVLETSNVTNMQSWFYDWSSLEEIEFTDTTRCTNFYGTFNGCKALKHLPANLDMSACTSAQSFCTNCENLEEIPMLDTSKITNTISFINCKKVTSIPLFDCSRMTFPPSFSGTRITEVPAFYFPNVTSLQGWLQASGSGPTAWRLKKIGAIDLSNVTNMTNVLYLQDQLEEIHWFGATRSWDCHWSTLLTETALIEILDNLGNAYNGSQTLTMGATNLAKLTSTAGQTALANAQAKGWTIA